MSVGGKLAMGALRLFFRRGAVRITSPEDGLAAARKYNAKHQYKPPTSASANDQHEDIAGCPCLIIHPKHQVPRRDAAILYLHGGLEQTWKDELIVARGYAKHAGMDVFYPVFPAITEAAAVDIIATIGAVYLDVVSRFDAGKLAVVGTSFGGTWAFELLNWLNMNHDGAPMPAFVIANSPGGVPDTPGDWAEMERLSAFDPLIGVSAVKNIIPLQRLLSDNTPLWAYCPVHEDFSHAPDTWVYYAQETLAGNHLAYERRYAECGVAERLHLSIQPGMMHAYACLPVFKESKHAYAEQLALLNAL